MKYKKITKEELDQFLRKHKLWLEAKEGGERLVLNEYDLSESDLRESDLRWSDLRWNDLSESDLSWSNLRGSNLRGSDLRWSDLSESDLSWSNLRGSDLRWSDLRESDLSWSNLRGSNLDFSCLPLWCGSLNANFDDRQLAQIAYHLVKAGLQSNNASEETKGELAKLVNFANKFHRADECGKIEERSESNG